MKKLSILIPCFNEIRTLPQVIQKLSNLGFPLTQEVIIIDDASTDGTREYLEQLRNEQRANWKVIFHTKNLGKGAAVRTGLAEATGDYVIIQDADLEYDPADIQSLVACAKTNNALAVYGSRNTGIKNKYLYPHFYYGSKALTWLLQILFRQKISDPETCYKLIHAELFRFLDIQEKGFGIEIEISAKLLSFHIPIFEVPIHYSARSFAEGKKIRYRDGIKVLWAIVKWRFWPLE